MEIRSSDVVPFPLEKVFHTFRDRMPEIARDIQNVDRIVVEKREQIAPGRVHLINHWYAVGEIPTVAKAFVKPDMLSWRDDATWDDKAHTASWRLETFFFRESVRCAGTTHFVERSASSTEVRIEAQLEIRIGDLPMVPGLLKKKVSSEIERFIAHLITPNLRNATLAVDRFLAREARAPSQAADTASEKPAAKRSSAGSSAKSGKAAASKPSKPQR